MSIPGEKGAKNFGDDPGDSNYFMQNRRGPEKEHKIELDGKEMWNSRLMSYVCRGAVTTRPFVIDLDLSREDCENANVLSANETSYENLNPHQRNYYTRWLEAGHHVDPYISEPYLLLHLAGVKDRISSQDISREELETIFSFLCRVHCNHLLSTKGSSAFCSESLSCLINLGYRLNKERNLSQEFAFILCCAFCNWFEESILAKRATVKEQIPLSWEKFSKGYNRKMQKDSDCLPVLFNNAGNANEWWHILSTNVINSLMSQVAFDCKKRKEERDAEKKAKSDKEAEAEAERKTKDKTRRKELRDSRRREKTRVDRGSKLNAIANSNTPGSIAAPGAKGGIGKALLAAAQQSDSLISRRIKEDGRKLK